ncbi:MAG TPA: hypothetical protein VK886_06465 [Vicinamibacterales bacterium]|nr:hypothetical protein [Vicinamibacterales bacterium]
MRRILLRVWLGSALLFLFVEQAPGPEAATTILWQTTFNCAEWTQSMGLSEAIVCLPADGLAGWGAWTTPGHPKGSEITLAANYPGGAGGRGFRLWRGDGFDVNSGAIAVILPAATSELWIRFYLRYEAGFSWNPAGSPGFTKETYFLGNSARDFTFGFVSSDRMWIWVNNGSTDYASVGWNTIMGGTRSDGQFHCYEYHVKRGTTTSNGVKEIWVDGVQRLSTATADLGTTGSWREFALGENANQPANGRDMFVDYDDVAVSTTGRIGCLGAPGPPPAPAAPTNLRIVR